MTSVSQASFEERSRTAGAGRSEAEVAGPGPVRGEWAHLLALLFRATFHGENLKSLGNLQILWRKCGRYVRLLINLRELRTIGRLLSEESLKDITLVQPAFPFKFLHERFLCLDLSISDRLRCLSTNLRFWKAMLTAEALSKIARGKSCTILEKGDGGCRVSIVLRLSLPSYLEGEMSAVLMVGEREAYIVSFTVVPGTVIGCDAAHALLISRMQGIKGALPDCRRAQNVLGVQAPRAVLDAVQGLAMAVGIVWLCGVDGEKQPFYTPAQHDVFKAAYDDFFAAVGMSRGPKGYPCAPIPIPPNPIGAANRQRARKRQGARQALVEAVRASALRLCLEPGVAR